MTTYTADDTYTVAEIGANSYRIARRVIDHDRPTGGFHIPAQVGSHRLTINGRYAGSHDPADAHDIAQQIADMLNAAISSDRSTR